MDVPETNGSAGDRTNEQSQFVCTEFAQRGYVAVSIDYRLASFFQILCLGLCKIWRYKSMDALGYCRLYI